MTAAPAALGVNDVLTRLASELLALQAMTADMENTVGDLLARQAEGLDARSMQNLQLLDMLRQSLQALARFCANAAALAPPEWKIDGGAAIANIPLASLAQRLAGHDGPGTEAEEGDALFPPG